MKWRAKLNNFRIKSLALVLALVLGAFALLPAAPAQAHCDSVNGPVVNAAREALAQNDVRLVLPYVQPEAEAELTAAFEQAMEVRRLGGTAQQLAETYFFETAVRLHRQGEGAPYTGLKYESDFGPALEAADRALETGSAKDVSKLLVAAVQDGLAEKFQAVLEARDHADRLGTVEAHRERAEAELMFEEYVLKLYNLATGDEEHAGGEAPAGHAAPQAAGPAEYASLYPVWP